MWQLEVVRVLTCWHQGHFVKMMNNECSKMRNLVCGNFDRK